MATYSSILVWEILWTEDPDGLQSLGSQRVGHDWAQTCTNAKEGAKISWSIGIGIIQNLFSYHSWIMLEINIKRYSKISHKISHNVTFTKRDLDLAVESLNKVQFSCSVVSNSLWPYGLQHARFLCPSTTPRAYSNSCPLTCWCHPSYPLSSPSPPAFKLSQYQGLFQTVSSSNQVAKILELQLQYQSSQWIFRIDLL